MRQRTKKWKQKKELEKKLQREGALSARNNFGVIDLTPYNAIRLIRGEPDKTIM